MAHSAQLAGTGPPRAVTRTGRLKVFLRAAPGVGKTYRKPDEAMLDGLDVLPRRECAYRGSRYAELDLAGVPARQPPGLPVLVTASALAGRVEIRITDRGPGLATADHERLFEPFQRLGDQDNSAGLGLPVPCQGPHRSDERDSGT